RQFLVGPNASGKSNFLDVFRFLHDIANPDGGGLQSAVSKRGGLSKIRSFHARNKSAEVFIRIDLSESNREFAEGDEDKPPKWTYKIGIKQEGSGSGDVLVSSEEVLRDGCQLLKRPDTDGQDDKRRLRHTHLEQVNGHKEFREMADFLSGISYFHLVPQMLRYSEEIQGRTLEGDPFGQGLLTRMYEAGKRTRDARLKKISAVIRNAIPNLEEIRFEQDQFGKCHITGSCTNWRSGNAEQREDQLSDGTLRLIGLVWSLLENNSVLLLEEPEISLHVEMVSQLAGFLYRAQREKRAKSQVFISTHSELLLSDIGIDGEEILVLDPYSNEDWGTKICSGADLDDIKILLEIGEPLGPTAIQHARPNNNIRLSFKSQN
ncbi:MAG: ATP-binding protein, partial [Gammaproteobacteria bacterium AqS3]|nr:ATP-binding protein [Gammaproteobacteria bacterium AqS3]